LSVDRAETLDFQLQLMDIECAYEHDIATIPSRCENTMQVEEFASIRKDLALPGAQQMSSCQAADNMIYQMRDNIEIILYWSK